MQKELKPNKILVYQVVELSNGLTRIPLRSVQTLTLNAQQSCSNEGVVFSMQVR